jgi:N-acetylmuramoyl-L-alanine amidase
VGQELVLQSAFSRFFSGLQAILLVLCVGMVATAHASPKSGPDPRSKTRMTVGGPVVTQIGVTQSAVGASIVIDISTEMRAQISAMLDPQRLLLDFEGVRFHASQVKIAEKDGLVRALRFGAFMQGQGRIVLDLGAPAHVAEQRFLPLDGGGLRLVITLQPTSPAAFRSLARPVSDDIVTGSTDQNQPQRDLPLIVLDPGHGGIDSGASGPSGELEKTLVLQFGQALKERLESGGKVRVLMTRTSDVFVPLRDRVRIARQAKAQLFISLHADALADEDNVRGASIYVLSERATDERSARLADKENKADLAAGLDTKDDQDEVADILFDLARRESRAFSSQFARQLVQTLPKATRMHKNPLRGAAFRVLRAPDVPSVLLELGYLTTADEAKLMMTDEWRRATADATAEAIERFATERINRERQ